MTAGTAALCALVWLGLAPLARVSDPQLAVDLAWLPTPGAELGCRLQKLASLSPGPVTEGHDPRDPWGRVWGAQGWIMGGSRGVVRGGSTSYSYGPDGQDDGAAGDDVVVPTDRPVQEFGRASVPRPPYTAPLGHWVLALGDQACGVLALTLGLLLVGERSLRRLGIGGLASLAWLAPAPAALTGWFAARSWAALKLGGTGLPVLVPHEVAAGGCAGLLALGGIWLWLRAVDAPATDAA